jgi:hypothetical protein
VTAAAPIVTVDGETVPASVLEQPRKVNPGHHVLTAHVEGGATVSATVDVAEGKEGSVDLAPPPAPILPKHEITVAPTDHPRSGLGPLIVGGIVVTSVGLFLGATGGLYAMGKTLDCPNNQCPQSQWQALDDARGAATVSTVGFSVAGAGVVLLVIGLLTHGTSKPGMGGRRARVLPNVAWGRVGVSGEF